MAGISAEQAQYFQEQALQMGVPLAWITDFLRRNPGDEHRILEAYRGEAGGAGGQLLAARGADYDTVTREYASPGLPPPPAPIAVSTGGGFALPGFASGGLSLTTILVIAGAALAAWYLLRKR